LAGRAVVRAAASGAVSSGSSAPASHAASSSDPASTTGIRSWTGAQTSLALVVRIVADVTQSSRIFA